jgi:hypothetical protein
LSRVTFYCGYWKHKKVAPGRISSRFSFTAPYEFIWLPDGETVPQRERTMILSKKIMIIIFWSSQGFHPINFLPKGYKVNARYYMLQKYYPCCRNGARFRSVGAIENY